MPATRLIAATVDLSADSNCRVTHYDQTATVRYVYDGDTLRLQDGRKIRLIGINTPELARDNKPAEAFAIDARNALKTLLNNDDTVHLRFGQETKDHYGRVLAHVFLSDGLNVQAELLKQGYARTIFIPPNTALSSCYLAQEHIAQCNKTNIWNKTRTINANQLQNEDTGFQIISGNLESMQINNKGIWLIIDKKLTVGIRPENRQLFDIKKLTGMLNHPVSVRGWLNKSKRTTPFYMRIRHPSAIGLSSEYICNAGE